MNIAVAQRTNDARSLALDSGRVVASTISMKIEIYLARLNAAKKGTDKNADMSKVSWRIERFRYCSRTKSPLYTNQ